MPPKGPQTLVETILLWSVTVCHIHDGTDGPLRGQLGTEPQTGGRLAAYDAVQTATKFLKLFKLRTPLLSRGSRLLLPPGIPLGSTLQTAPTALLESMVVPIRGSLG